MIGSFYPTGCSAQGPHLSRSPCKPRDRGHHIDLAAEVVTRLGPYGDPLDRNDLSGTTADLATLDLYSCFPIAVFNMTDVLGVIIGRLHSDHRRFLATTSQGTG